MQDIYRLSSSQGTRDFDTYTEAREAFQVAVAQNVTWAEVWEIGPGQAWQICTFKMDR